MSKIELNDNLVDKPKLVFSTSLNAAILIYAKQKTRKL